MITEDRPMNADLFGNRSKAELRAERSRKLKLGTRRKEKLRDVKCAWHRLRARVLDQALARLRALPQVYRDPPAAYETWTENRRLRFWHGMPNAYGVRTRWYRDEDDCIQCEISRADRAYAKRCATIETEYKRALAA
jgi:hypothetical protein